MPSFPGSTLHLPCPTPAPGKASPQSTQAEPSLCLGLWPLPGPLAQQVTCHQHAVSPVMRVPAEACMRGPWPGAPRASSHAMPSEVACSSSVHRHGGWGRGARSTCPGSPGPERRGEAPACMARSASASSGAPCLLFLAFWALFVFCVFSRYTEVEL